MSFHYNYLCNLYNCNYDRKVIGEFLKFYISMKHEYRCEMMENAICDFIIYNGFDIYYEDLNNLFTFTIQSQNRDIVLRLLNMCNGKLLRNRLHSDVVTIAFNTHSIFPNEIYLTKLNDFMVSTSFTNLLMPNNKYLAIQYLKTFKQMTFKKFESLIYLFAIEIEDLVDGELIKKYNNNEDITNYSNIDSEWYNVNFFLNISEFFNKDLVFKMGFNPNDIFDCTKYFTNCIEYFINTIPLLVYSIDAEILKTHFDLFIKILPKEYKYDIMLRIHNEYDDSIYTIQQLEQEYKVKMESLTNEL